ncbi:MAG: Slp family lipoprotein, partial [bacterium]|nr:Slp family lipoprotein [bacterium]
MEGHDQGWKRLGLLMTGIALFQVLSGCASRVVPPELMPKVNRNISFQELTAEPQKYRGQLVVLGGVIIASANKQQGTELEILQQPLSRVDEPRGVDQSGGRFIASYPGYLETTVYKKDRKVTIVGEVTGNEDRTLGEIINSYPENKALKVHLWPLYDVRDKP